MALSNYLFLKSYVNISRLVFEKDFKRISCTLNISTSDRKQSSIKEVSLTGDRKVLSLRIANTPPSNPQHEDAYFLKGNLQGDWKNYPNHIASWDKFRNVWNYWFAINWHDFLYLEDTGEYVRIVEGEFVPCVCGNDVRIWDKFFSPEILDKSNHIKQFYLYLKSLDEFKNCVDA